MSTDHHKPVVKEPNGTHRREEVFLNVFMSIAQKGISEWEHLRKTKGNDG